MSHRIVQREAGEAPDLPVAIELAKLDKRRVRVVEYKRPASLVEEMVGFSQARTQSFDAAALLDLTAPRAYYLATWLPAVVRSESPQE